MNAKPGHIRFTKEQLRSFREKLEQRRHDLAKVEQALEDEALLDLAEERTGEISKIRMHAADLGTEEIEREVALHLAEDEIAELQSIDEALAKIQNLTYGVCQDCGCEIPFARLEVLPYTRFCAGCQNKMEKSDREHTHRLARW